MSKGPKHKYRQINESIFNLLVALQETEVHNSAPLKLIVGLFKFTT